MKHDTRNVSYIYQPPAHPLQIIFERLIALIVLSFIGIWMMKVFLGNAYATSSDVDEVYSNPKSLDVGDEDEKDDYARVDVRLTRPDEGNSRLSEDGYAMVPGSERLKENSSLASKGLPSGASDRKIASLDVGAGAVAESAKASPEKPMSRIEAPVEAAFPSVKNDIIRDEPRPVKPGMYQEVSIIVSDHGYYPNRVFVTQNIPVHMYLTTPSKNTLCFMIDSWGVKKGVTPGKVEEVTFMPDQAGNFRFYCPVKGIEGTMTVRESRQAEVSDRNVASDSGTKISKAYNNQENLHTELKVPRPLKMLSDDDEIE